MKKLFIVISLLTIVFLSNKSSYAYNFIDSPAYEGLTYRDIFLDNNLAHNDLNDYTYNYYNIPTLINDYMNVSIFTSSVYAYSAFTTLPINTNVYVYGSARLNQPEVNTTTWLLRTYSFSITGLWFRDFSNDIHDFVSVSAVVTTINDTQQFRYQFNANEDTLIDFDFKKMFIIDLSIFTNEPTKEKMDSLLQNYLSFNQYGSIDDEPKNTPITFLYDLWEDLGQSETMQRFQDYLTYDVTVSVDKILFIDVSDYAITFSPLKLMASQTLFTLIGLLAIKKFIPFT